MSATPVFTAASSSFAAQELNIANVAGDYYHDQSKTYNDNRVTIKSTSRIEPLDRLLGHVAHGALHDSAERGPHAPKCHPETRTAVQRDIMSWIRHGEEDDTPRKVLWLSGPAGSGKTAIAGTLADECYKTGSLAASFFFSAFAGSANRRVKKPLIPTLVYRLIQHKSIVGLKEEVLTVIEDDPGVFERHIDQQIEELVLKPFRKLAGRSNRRDWPSVIIVNGLDECQADSECSGADAQKEILYTLSRAGADPAFPFRIIIASRPEPVIRHFFSNSPGLALNIFLDNKYEPDADIRLFLNAMFSDIRRRFNLPLTWASKDVVDLLVDEASGQFIYAATVIRSLDNPRLGPPQQQLARVLEWRRLGDSKPFAALDTLYNCILQTSPEPLLAIKWLYLLNHHAVSSGDSADFHLYLKGLIESYPGQIEYVLGSLTSLVGLVDEKGEPRFHFYHKSLHDFLLDPNRCSNLHVNEPSIRHFIGDQYYRVLQARGPQSNAGPSTTPPSHNFVTLFCVYLCNYIDLHRSYTPGDVEWCLLNLYEYHLDVEVPRMFVSVHRKCKWYRCLPACGVWRKGILRYCRERGWRVPTRKEMLRDRFKKFQFYEPEEFPLQPPLRYTSAANSMGTDPSLKLLPFTVAVKPSVADGEEDRGYEHRTHRAQE